MSGSNQFRVIATGVGANALAPAAYASLTSLLSSGYQSGVAQSAQINTTLRQATFVATAIAQAIADQTGAAVNDDGVVANFENQFLAMLQTAPYLVAHAGGSADALSASVTPAPSALTDGQMIFLRAAATNTTTTPTFALNSTGAKTIVKGTGTAVAASDIVGAGHWLQLQYDSTLTKWVLLNPSGGISGGGGGGQPGDVFWTARSTAPTGSLKANGALVSRTTYASLFAAIGTTFGVGDGSTTFGLPDVRGEFVRGWDDSRGVDSGRSMGSSQSADIAAHAHPYDWSAIQSGGSVGGSNNLAVAANTGGGTYNTRNSSGTETRPRNVAMLGCIRY